jgi:mRNA interferase HigB
LTFDVGVPILHVIKRKTLIDFYEKHPTAKGQLESWYAEASKANWKNTSDIKKRFVSASFLEGNRVVFNICGNNFRLIVRIAFQAKTVYIRFVGTHAEYSKIDAENV